MQLSVIIVNYNVKHFLEQCLFSVCKATQGIESEIIVVDNHSADNSVEYLRPSFPGVRFICNTENLGFAKACNQGRALASGNYIVFLNPDTIIPEDCFRQCMAFLSSQPDAGALGIKMLDGSGRFLKESKRSFPSPLTSLYKLFGLSRLFPRSRTFSRYHLGHIDENKTHSVDVLAGAFMMLKKEVLEKVGGFDEAFFMYGEDVDLSYRIQQSGFKNYYFAGSNIIHFKGESTRKGSMNYVRMFYTAMSIFVRKHYGGSRAGIFNFLVHTAIWFRAGLTAIGHFIRRVGLPLLDAGLILLSFWLVKNIWNEYVKTEIHYENRLLWVSFPLFTIFYLLTAYYAGLYDRWYKRTELVRSTLIASIVLLAGYALLPEQYRFSRAIILFGALLAFVLISVLRWMLIQTHVLSSNKEKEGHFSTVIAGSPEEFNESMELLTESGLQQEVLGRVVLNENESNAIGHWKELKKLSRILPFREIIYCEGTLSFRDIIESMQQLPRRTRVKIHASGSRGIVGSLSRNISGEALSKENGFKLANPYNRRLKRLVDILVSVVALITFPLQFLLVKKPFSFLGNCFSVLLAQKTWIGYAASGKDLPRIRPGVIASNGQPLSVSRSLPAESLQRIDYWYARDYDPVNDLKLIARTYRVLGG